MECLFEETEGHSFYSFAGWKDLFFLMMTIIVFDDRFCVVSWGQVRWRKKDEVVANVMIIWRYIQVCIDLLII